MKITLYFETKDIIYRNDFINSLKFLLMKRCQVEFFFPKYVIP